MLMRTTAYKWMTWAQVKEHYALEEDSEVDDIVFWLQQKRREVPEGYIVHYKVKVDEKWEVIETDRRRAMDRARNEMVQRERNRNENQVRIDRDTFEIQRPR